MVCELFSFGAYTKLSTMKATFNISCQMVNATSFKVANGEVNFFVMKLEKIKINQV